MIQRIQTIYLFLVAILITLPLLFSFAHIPLLEGFYSLPGTTIDGPSRLEKLLDTSIITAWCGLMITLPLIAIFSYKRHAFQCRLCVVEIVLLLGAILFGWFVGDYRTAAGLQAFGFILLVACGLLVFLALWKIREDIKFLKSSSRIR